MAISNKDVEVLSEALFVIILQFIVKKKDKDYYCSYWNNVKKVKVHCNFTNKYGITSMVSNVQ